MSLAPQLGSTVDAVWVRIVSWHILSGVTSRGGMVKCLCGKWADVGAPQAEERPAGKTCETCLRIKVGR